MGLSEELGRYKNLDKSSWGPGPWQDEVDYMDWKDEKTGFLCYARRNPQFGHWCGYVGVSHLHPAYGTPEFGRSPSSHFEVKIAFEFERGNHEVVWLFGFDCAQRLHLAPGLAAQGMLHRSVFEPYITADELKEECRSLASYLHVLGQIKWTP